MLYWRCGNPRPKTRDSRSGDEPGGLRKANLKERRERHASGAAAEEGAGPPHVEGRENHAEARRGDGLPELEPVEAPLSSVVERLLVRHDEEAAPLGHRRDEEDGEAVGGGEEPEGPEANKHHRVPEPVHSSPAAVLRGPEVAEDAALPPSEVPAHHGKV